MELSDYLKALGRRWFVVAIALVLGIGGSLLATAVAERQYESTAKLIVGVAASGTPAETYQGGMYAQSRVVPFIELIKGQTVAARTVEALNLDMSADELRSKIDAKSEAQSVVISLTVKDTSAQRAADIANGASEQFIRLARTAETPADGGGPLSIVKVVEPATVPQAAVSPNAKRNLALGALAGLIIGVTGAVAIDRARSGRGASTIEGVGEQELEDQAAGRLDDRTEKSSDESQHDTEPTGRDADDTDDFAWLPPSASDSKPPRR